MTHTGTQNYAEREASLALLPSKVMLVLFHWPRYRHISWSLPSVKNYLGRSVPPALQLCSSTVVELPLTDDAGKTATTRVLLLVFCCYCLVCKRRSQKSSFSAQITLCLSIFTDFKWSQYYAVYVETLNCNCKIIFRNIYKTIGYDRLHNLRLDQLAFRVCGSLNKQILFCFNAVNSFQTLHPALPSLLIAYLRHGVGSIIPKNPSESSVLTPSSFV